MLVQINLMLLSNYSIKSFKIVVGKIQEKYNYTFSSLILGKFNKTTADEKIDWVTRTKSIPWSRLEKFNFNGLERGSPLSKFKEYDIEIDRKLYSLWGNIHPNMKHFKRLTGKQHLPCCIVALVMAQLYHIDEWTSLLLDSIVVHGTNFLKNVIENKTQENELSIDDFVGICKMDSFNFKVNLQLEIVGQLYDDIKGHINLNMALDYAFVDKKLSGVILLCAGRFLAIGNHENKTFFMYDCQSQGGPLFKTSQGTTYVLKCCCMKILLASIVLTLSIKQHAVKFHLYSVPIEEVQEPPKGILEK